jgi:hypothetical protein
MRNRALPPWLAVVALVALLAAACNNPAYTRATVESDLQREVHLSPAQADCLTQQLEAQITPDQLSSHTEPSDLERQQFRGALQYALVACSGAPYNATAVAQELVQHAGLTEADAACVARHVGDDVGAGNVTSAEFEAALLRATAVCASPSSPYSRAAAKAAVSSIGYANYADCLAALFEPRAVAPSLAALTTGVGKCLAPPSTTTTAATAVTTTTTG